MKPGPLADRVYVAHMLECITRVLHYTAEGEKAFRQSPLIQDAVIRNLQVMAESSQRLSDAAKTSAPSVPWRALAGFRNIVVHDYLSLDLDAIWSVIASDLPLLQQALQQLKE